MNLFLMNHQSVSWIKKDSFINSILPIGRLLGRGSFSIAYECAERNSVVKITVDPAAYRFASGMSGNRLAPLMRHDMGEIAQFFGRYPVYLFEQERLQPLGREARKEVAAAIRKAHKLNSISPDEPLARGEVLIPGIDPCDFALLYRLRRTFKFTPDLKPNNFMQRDTGEVVAVDPWYCHKTMAAITISRFSW